MPTELLQPNPFVEAYCDGLKPDEKYLVSEWMEKKFYLPPGTSPEPGFFRFDRTPFLREIADCLSPQSPVREVKVIKGTQLGFTTIGLGWLSSIMDLNPGPSLMIVENLDKARDYSKTKLNPVLEANLGFGKVRVSSSRDQDNTNLYKEFPGGYLKLTGANSSSGITSLSAQNLLMDETDRWPDELPGEGSTHGIAEKRTDAFTEISKKLKGSTPTVKGESYIEQEYEDSDQREYEVPCPFCGQMQALTWGNVKFTKDDQRNLTGPARYQCGHCKALIDEHHKGNMVQQGAWIPKNPGHRHRGYRISSLYSPWLSWTDMAVEWLKAHKMKDRSKDTTALQTFINNRLAEPWEEKGEKVEVNLVARCYDYFPEYGKDDPARPMVPMNAAILTAGVDVQDDRLEVEVVGWGKGRESWSIDYRVIVGDPRVGGVWKELDGYLGRQWTHESGGQIIISKAAVDTGFLAPVVYNYVRPRQPQVCAIKGRGGAGYFLASQPTKIEKYKVQLYNVGVDGAKDLIFGWLNYEDPGEGYCHFPLRPHIYNKAHFDKLMAEERMRTKDKNGKPVHTYKLPSGKRNEALDCRVYALAALAILNPVDLDRLVDELVARAQRIKQGLPEPPRQSGRRVRSQGVEI